jgi:hypothetical protein
MQPFLVNRGENYTSRLESQQLASQFEDHELVDNQFKYEPLEDVDSIRLLFVEPALHGDGGLQCNMIHTTLSTSLAFTALSYVWGTPAQTGYERRVLWIDGKQVLIGLNLYDALLHLRDEKEVLLIWADAVCIDQLNLKERNHQVCKMRDIYSRAETTVIYLGADDGGNTVLVAWNFLERECSDTIPIAEESLPTNFRGDMSNVEISVLSRPWFRRVWVFQEVIVSKRPLVQCGWRRTTWDSFCKVILLRPRLNDRYGWSLSKKPLFQYVVDMFLARCDFLRENGLHHLLPPWFDDIQDNIGKGSHILTTLSRARRLNSSDPRDKIYAVLGVSSGIDLEDDRIAIDYNKTVDQLYAAFARYLIDSTQSYDVLSYVGKRQLQSRPAARWKSWVADWRVPLGPPRTILSILEQEDHNVQGRRNYQVILNHRWTWNTLNSVGRIIGRIVGPLPQEIHLSGLDEETLQRIRDTSQDDESAADRQILSRWREYPLGFCWFHTSSRQKQRGLPQSIWPSVMFGLNLAEDPPKNLDPKLLDSHKSGWFPRRRKGKQTQPRSDQRSPLSDSKKTTEFEEQKPSCSPKQDGKLTVEEMLLLRSRTTTSWSGDRSGIVNLVVDESSIIEGRCLANYMKTTSDAPRFSNMVDNIAAAMVPKATQIGDLVITLKGSRLPFVVRRREPFGSVESRDLPLVFCGLVGECFVNEYMELDSVLAPEITKNGMEDCWFVFGNVNFENSENGDDAKDPEAVEGGIPKMQR